MSRSAQKKIARMQASYDKRVPVKEIARRENVSPSYVYSHITTAKRGSQEEISEMQALYDKRVPVKEIARRKNVSPTWVYSHILISNTEKQEKQRQEKQKLSEIIRARLAEIGKTQKWLTRETGITIPHYARANTFPPEDKLKRIYSALGIKYAPLDKVYQRLVQSARKKGHDSLEEYINSLSPQENKQKLSEIIRTRLAELGKTQTWLGREAGVTRATVSLYSQRKVIPKEDVFKKMCAALGIEYALISEVYENLVQAVKEKGFDSPAKYRAHIAKQTPKRQTPKRKNLPKEKRKKLGEIINIGLVELGKTPAWLSEETSIREAAVNKYIGGTEFPPEGELEKILSALDFGSTSIDEIYEDLEQLAIKKGFDSVAEYKTHISSQLKGKILSQKRKKRLGEIIKTRLAELGKTQTWLGREIGGKKTNKYIGGTEFPPEGELEKILSALDFESTSIDEIYEDMLKSVRKKGFKSLEEYRAFLDVF
jgi:transcriptional regulator with XRE-family HTH domain